jgi:hypothetical protein
VNKFVDRLGTIVAEFRFAHSALGWAKFEEKMKPFAGCPIALETSSGPAVDQLLQRDWSVYPVNPKAAQRYRERKAPSGNKADRPDAWSLADALRTDGHAWHKLIPQDEVVVDCQIPRSWRRASQAVGPSRHIAQAGAAGTEVLSSSRLRHPKEQGLPTARPVGRR